MNLLRPLLLASLAVLLPAAGRAGLLVEPLNAPLPAVAPAPRAPDLVARPEHALVARAGDPPAKAKEGEQGKPPPGSGARPAAPAPGDLDFDLLGEASPPPDAPDAAAMKLRRQMLTWHQGIGIGLYALEVGTTVLGQLNYRDKFATHQNTEKWRTPHKAFAYATTAMMVLNGTLALAAPAPVKKPFRFDRVTAHKIAMFTAAAGMAAQIGLGIYTHSREGYMDQQSLARAHLAIGYATFAAMTAGVAVLVF